MTGPTGTLAWVRPSRLSMRWELRKGEDVLGTLSPPHTFGTGAAATFGAEAYNLRKGGVRRPGAAIWKMGGEDRLAVMTADALGRETVVTPDGSAYKLSRIGTTDDWMLSRADGEEVFGVHRGTEGKKPAGSVDVLSPDPRLPALLLLCWFVISTAER